MNNKRIRIVILVAAITGMMAVGSIMAYFTDGESVSNTFTVGKIALELQEPNWNPDEAKNITPMKNILKDPQVKNSGVNPEFVFLEITVPCKNVVTANADGSRKESQEMELYKYEINEGWTQLGVPQKDEEEETVTHLYVYGTETACTELAKDAVTPTLFDSVTFVNVVEGQELETSANDIVVNAYGIQTTDINGGKTNPSDVSSVLKMQ